ncbi:unnamed protein product, partial [Mesorhabditis belari]|uniref:Uncharacterized protein n=1 Tax=Mesorhabditis belari TaxID=2138241 RepID=A0AAF3F6J3_9BILA
MMKMLKARKGRLVNVTSISGRCPIPGLGPYTLTKHAATAWTDIVRKELSMFGVEVYIIEPGFVRTHLTDVNRLERCNWDHYNKAPQEIREEYGYDFMHKFIENQKMTVEIMACPNTKRVVDDYVKAVTSVYCRTRMKMGWDTWLVWHLSSFFPTNLQDFYLNNLGVIFGPNIPAAMRPHCSHCKLSKEKQEHQNEAH